MVAMMMMTTTKMTMVMTTTTTIILMLMTVLIRKGREINMTIRKYSKTHNFIISKCIDCSFVVDLYMQIHNTCISHQTSCLLYYKKNRVCASLGENNRVEYETVQSYCEHFREEKKRKKEN